MDLVCMSCEHNTVLCHVFISHERINSVKYMTEDRIMLTGHKRDRDVYKRQVQGMEKAMLVLNLSLIHI